MPVRNLMALLLVVSCKAAPPPSPAVPPPAEAKPPASAPARATEGAAPGDLDRAETTIPGRASGDPVDAGSGGSVFLFGRMFLLGSLMNSPTPVYLHIEEIQAAPGSEAEFYFDDPQSLHGYTEANYIGSISNVDGTPIARDVTRGIADFDAGGRHYRARTALRDLHELTIAMVVRRGSVTFDHFVLSNESSAQRAARLARAAPAAHP